MTVRDFIIELLNEDLDAEIISKSTGEKPEINSYIKYREDRRDFADREVVIT